MMISQSTVLIVDDVADAREVLGDLLGQNTYRLFFAADGLEALKLAAAQRPDLILLDVMMPGMDGFEVCQHLRSNPDTAEIPVIMLTALDDRASLLQALEAGADDFLSKPIDRIELQLRVRTITRLNRYRRLHNERSRFERLVELSPHGLAIVDEQGQISLANPALRRLTGITEPEGHLLGELFVGEQQKRCRNWISEVISSQTNLARIESVLACADGLRRPVEVDAGSFRWEGQAAAQVIVRDISDRKLAELLESDRRRLAYDLHDGAAQLATAVHQRLQAFAHRQRSRSPATRDAINTLLDLAQRTVSEIRRVIAGLRPSALDDFGLATALRMQCEALNAEGWSLLYEGPTCSIPLPPDLELALFRIAQEALTNIGKHAGTRTATVRLALGSNRACLEIVDTGTGFDPETINAGPGRQVGLQGMYERAAILGGQLSITSRPGVGTSIRAEIPLETAEQAGSYDKT